MNIKKSEILRYLGYGKNKPNLVISNIIDESINIIKDNSDMKMIYNIFDVIVENNTIIINSNLKFESYNLSKNLKDCNNIILFAATLGTKVDMIIKKYSKMNMSYAVIMQAVSTTIIEEYCDICQKEIENSIDNKFLRPRFSPGYGDFSINYQKDIINLLQSPKKIGLMLTDSLMLIPSKSVTAVIGVSDIKQNCNIKGCEECVKLDCIYRRS